MEEKIEIKEQNEQQKKPQKKPMSPKKKVKIIIASMIGEPWYIPGLRTLLGMPDCAPKTQLSAISR